jgi:hypothetical protein
MPGKVREISLWHPTRSTTTAGAARSLGHFTVNSADIAFLAPGQTLTQDYAVTVADNFGGTAAHCDPQRQPAKSDRQSRGDTRHRLGFLAAR